MIENVAMNLPRLVLWSLMYLPLTCFSQGTITGKVISPADAPLIGAHVWIENVARGAFTDHRGRFQITQVPSGSHALSITHVGYTSLREEIKVEGVEKLERTFRLAPGDVMLADVLVSAGTGLPVNAFTQVDIMLRPVNTSQDILRMIPGLFIAQHAGGGKAEQIFLRGFDIDHGTDLNLEVDGMPVNMVSHAHGQGYSDLHFVIPELIDYVDFNPGPYRADKGDFATAGYVSFVTKAALDENFARVEAGRFGTVRTVVGTNIGANENSFGYVAGEYFRSDGYFESPQDFDRINLVTRYTVNAGKADEVSMLGSYFTSAWNASGQVPERAIRSGRISRFGAIDDTEGGETRRVNTMVRHHHTFDDGGSFEHQLFASRYDFDLFSNFTFYLNDPLNGDQIRQQESRMLYGYKARYKRHASLFGKHLELEFGGGVRHDDIDDIALMHTVKREFLEDVQRGDIRETNLNAYTEVRLELDDSWSLRAGLRLDHFRFAYDNRMALTSKSVNKTIVSPKLNLDYRISPAARLYLRSGIGFHSNDARVVVAEDGKDVLPRAYGIDLGGDFRIGQNLLLHMAIWQLDLDQEFVYVGDEGVVEPGGKTRRRGVDVSVRYQLLPGLFFDGDLNFTRPVSRDDPAGEDHIPLAPVISSVGGLTVRNRHGFNSSLRYRYLGNRPANEDNSVVAGGYVLADLVLNYSRPPYEVGVTVQNLFDVEWNEAQFDTESRLFDEASPVSEIHFTPGVSRFFQFHVSFFW